MFFRKPVRPQPSEVDAPPPIAPLRPLPPPEPSPLVPPCVDAVLTASIEVLCARATEATDPLCGELLGSDASGIWWMPSCAYGAPGTDFERRIGFAYASALDLRGGPDGLAALRALQAGAAPGIADAVAPTAERLAGRGIADPPWWRHARGLRTVRAVELSAADDGHRSRIVFVELERATARMTLGVLIDADAAGVAASVGVFDTIDAIRAAIEGDPRTEAPVDEMIRPVPIGEARRRVLRAIERTDLLGTTEHYGPGFVGFRALALRWMTCPDGADPDAPPAAA